MVASIQTEDVRHQIWEDIMPCCRVCSHYGWEIFTQCRRKNPWDRCEAFYWGFDALNKLVDKRLCEYLLWQESERR